MGACYGNGNIRNDSFAQNDEIQYAFSHKAGNYKLHLLTRTDANSCIITVRLDGVSQGTIDLYSAGAVQNVKKTLSITIIGDANHILDMKAETKNVLSGAYGMLMQFWWIED